METDLDEDVVFESCNSASAWLRVLNWLTEDGVDIWHVQYRSVLLHSRLMLESDVNCVAEFHRDVPDTDSSMLLYKAVLALFCITSAAVLSSIYAPLSFLSAPLSVLYALPFVWHSYRRCCLRREVARVRRFVDAASDVTTIVNKCVQCLSEAFFLCRGAALSLGYTDGSSAFAQRFGFMLDTTFDSLDRLCGVYRVAIVEMRRDSRLNEDVFGEGDELERFDTTGRSISDLKRLSGVFVRLQSLFVRRLCLCTCTDARSDPDRKPRLPASTARLCVTDRLRAQKHHLFTAYRYHVVANGTAHAVDGGGRGDFSDGGVIGDSSVGDSAIRGIDGESRVATCGESNDLVRSSVPNDLLSGIHALVMQCEATTATVRLIEEEIQQQHTSQSDTRTELPTARYGVVRCLENVRRRLIDLAALCDKMCDRFDQNLSCNNNTSWQTDTENTEHTDEGCDEKQVTCDQFDVVDEFLEAIADGGLSDGISDSHLDNDVKLRQRCLFTQDLLSELDVVLEDKRSEWTRREALAKNRSLFDFSANTGHHGNTSDSENASIAADRKVISRVVHHILESAENHVSAELGENGGQTEATMMNDVGSNGDEVEDEKIFSLSRGPRYVGGRHGDSSTDHYMEDRGFPLQMAAQAAAMALRRRKKEDTYSSSDEDSVISG